jgi:tungstate transport system substrate-binding protein
MGRRMLLILGMALLAGAPSATAAAAERALILATTTSVYDSGLLDHLLPKFTAQSGVEVRAVVRGTGAALRLGVSGDADVVLVHDRAAEDKFVAAGHGAFRRDVMRSRFLIVGPRGDPAGLSRLRDTGAVLRRIAATKSLFLSRGDSSGTHNAELRLWRASGVDPRGGKGSWYREIGSGMGATLNITADMNAHTLTESGTWANFGNRANLAVLHDHGLINPYGVILVNPQRHPHILETDARRFIDWLTGPAAQQVIDNFTINGEHPFRSAAS